MSREETFVVFVLSILVSPVLWYFGIITSFVGYALGVALGLIMANVLW